MGISVRNMREEKKSDRRERKDRENCTILICNLIICTSKLLNSRKIL